MRYSIVLRLLVFSVGLFAQPTTQHTELPYMHRVPNFELVELSDGTTLYAFSSRTCGTSDWLIYENGHDDPSHLSFNFLTEALLPKPYSHSCWVIARTKRWHLMEIDRNGTVLLDWELPVEVSTIYTDPVLKYAEKLTLLLDGKLYTLDPFEFIMVSHPSEYLLKDFVFDPTVRQIVAFNDSLYCLINSQLQVVSVHPLAGIRDIIWEKSLGVLLLSNRRLFALNSSGNRTSLINFGRNIPVGRLMNIGPQLIFLESTSNLIWQHLHVLNPAHWQLMSSHDLYEMGIVLPFSIEKAREEKLFIVGYNGTCYEKAIIDFDGMEASVSKVDVEIMDLKGSTEDVLLVDGSNQVLASLILQIRNQSDVSINYFTLAWREGDSACSSWKYQKIIVEHFLPGNIMEVSFNMIWEWEGDSSIEGSLELPELWIIAVNGYPDANKKDNFFKGILWKQVLSAGDINHSSESVNVYPNPCQQWIRVSAIDSPFQSISIFDTNGREVYVGSASQEYIDVSRLPSGKFYWRITSQRKQQSWSGSIIKLE